MVDNNVVKSLDRALDILEEIVYSDTACSIKEISEKTNLHKSTVHRLLKTLKYRGYIKKDSYNSTYKVGMKLFEIGSRMLNNLDLRKTTKPFLRELKEETNETIHLGVLDNDEIIYIDKIESEETIRMDSKIGVRVPAQSTALGKVILAYSSDERLNNILEEKGLPKHTEKTIVNRKEYLSEIKDIKEKGYGIDNEEHERGIRCIAGPIFDHTGEILAAFSISGPSNRMTTENVEKLKPVILKYSKLISKAFGYNQNNI